MNVGLHITTNHTGKMQGINSLSTSRTCNKNCYYNSQVPGSICQKCYAARILKRYKNTEKAMTRNYSILTKSLLPASVFPVLNDRIFRLESFGDLENATQALNYFTFCNVNPSTTFALWTKNPHIIAAALKAGAEKPKNLIIVYSSLYINKRENLKKVRALYPFIDKIFTVWTPEKAKEENITINCGARRCLECGRCYSKKTEKYINELLR